MFLADRTCAMKTKGGVVEFKVTTKSYSNEIAEGGSTFDVHIKFRYTSCPDENVFLIPH